MQHLLQILPHLLHHFGQGHILGGGQIHLVADGQNGVDVDQHLVELVQAGFQVSLGVLEFRGIRSLLAQHVHQPEGVGQGRAQVVRHDVGKLLQVFVLRKNLLLLPVFFGDVARYHVHPDHPVPLPHRHFHHVPMPGRGVSLRGIHFKTDNLAGEGYRQLFPKQAPDFRGQKLVVRVVHHLLFRLLHQREKGRMSIQDNGPFILIKNEFGRIIKQGTKPDIGIRDGRNGYHQLGRLGARHLPQGSPQQWRRPVGLYPWPPCAIRALNSLAEAAEVSRRSAALSAQPDKPRGRCAVTDRCVGRDRQRAAVSAADWAFHRATSAGVYFVHTPSRRQPRHEQNNSSTSNTINSEN